MEEPKLPTKDDVLLALRAVHDPEIPINVVDLGLIYRVDFLEDGQTVDVDMTLTAMGCPVMDQIKADAEAAIMSVPGVDKATVNFVWTPPWTPAKVSEQGRRELQMYGFHV